MDKPKVDIKYLVATRDGETLEVIVSEFGKQESMISFCDESRKMGVEIICVWTEADGWGE